MSKHTEGKADFRKAAFNTIDIVVGTKGIGRLGIFSSTNEEEDEANAARLVKCWNMHDELIEALKEIQKTTLKGKEVNGEFCVTSGMLNRIFEKADKLIKQSEQ